MEFKTKEDEIRMLTWKINFMDHNYIRDESYYSERIRLTEMRDRLLMDSKMPEQSKASHIVSNNENEQLTLF